MQGAPRPFNPHKIHVEAVTHIPESQKDDCQVCPAAGGSIVTDGVHRMCRCQVMQIVVDALLSDRKLTPDEKTAIHAELTEGFSAVAKSVPLCEAITKLNTIV